MPSDASPATPALEPWRPPYKAAVAVFVAVLTGYLLTLAPSVTFWDAGEFIAAAHTLGIPHPPGTPLFVLVGHVWTKIFPFGEVAFRTNVLSATFSAAGAGCFFVVIHGTAHRMVAGVGARSAAPMALLGAGAAAVIGAFTFTNWQNSNETEVYAVATFTIAAIALLSLLWRRDRGTGREGRWLLLIVYLEGISMGNHLLALLVGPAVVAFLAATVWLESSPTPAVRREEWAQVAVVAGVWALLTGTGLGSTTVTALGGLCFLAAAIFAATAGALPFAALTFLFASVGVTTYLFLYIRAGQHPILNEADPSTFHALLDVIRRAQYPPRTPLDDPTVMSGPGNPGRSLTIIWLQFVNYAQYFSWQWTRAIRGTVYGIPAYIFPTWLFLVLGFYGLYHQWKVDRPAAWLLLVLWLTTGLGLMAYMNFRPGHSLAWDLFPSSNDHEVRERDYFFVVSFVVWGLWSGLGLLAIARQAIARAGRWGPIAAGAALGLAVVPIAGNAAAATRRHPADARLAADIAYDLLNSVPPYGILFTYGDNDTFPLWWAQEVEGIRQDVTVVCLALAQTEWYVRQLRDNPIRPFDPDRAPEVWRNDPGVPPTWPVHSMTDADITSAAIPRMIDRPITIPIGPLSHTLPAREALYLGDVAVLRTLQQNLGRRPVAWSVTAGSRFYGLDRYLLQQGLARRLLTAPPDTAEPWITPASITGVPLDVPLTEHLVWETFRYGGLLEHDLRNQDDTNASFSATLSLPFTQLAYAYEALGDSDRTITNLERAYALAPNPAIAAALSQIRLDRLQDSSAADGR